MPPSHLALGQTGRLIKTWMGVLAREISRWQTECWTASTTRYHKRNKKQQKEQKAPSGKE